MNKTELVKVLKEQLVNLVGKYQKNIENGDIRKSIELIKLIKETTNLIDSHDYEFMVSSYSTEEDGEFKKMVSVWEQNSDGNIRNHRVWEVNKEVK